MDGLHGHGKAINRREFYIFTFHNVTSSSLDSHVIATGSFDTCGPPPAWHTVLCLRKGSTRPIVAKWDGKNFGAVGGIGVDQMAEDINAMLSQLVVVFTGPRWREKLIFQNTGTLFYQQTTFSITINSFPCLPVPTRMPPKVAVLSQDS